MNFVALVHQLKLGPTHELVACHLLSEPVCVPLLLVNLHLDGMTMHRVVSDFLSLGLCKTASDANFLQLDTANILDLAQCLDLDMTEASLTRPRIEKPPAPLQLTREVETPLARRLRRGGRSARPEKKRHSTRR